MSSTKGSPSFASSSPQGDRANILDNSSEYCQEILDYCKALPERARLFVLFRALAWDVPLTELHHLLNAVGIAVGEGEIWTVGTVLRKYRNALPPEAVPQVLEVAQRLGGDVRLHSELPAQAQEPDSRVLVRMREEGSTLHLSWGVRPFGLVASPVMEAGQGAQKLYHSRSNILYSVQRDFAAEKAAVEALFRACPTLAEYRRASCTSGSDAGFVVEEPQDALRCLLELGEHSAAVLEWRGEGKKRVRRGRLANVHVSLSGDGVWAKMTGTLQVNGGEEELTALWNGMEMAQGDFVPVGEGDYLALTKDFRRMLQRLQLMARQKTADAADAALHIPQLAAQALEELLRETDVGTADNTWKGMTEHIRDAMQYTPIVPEDLRAQLRPYQEEGFVWLARLARWRAGACLADEMGLGKSVQAFAAAYVRERYFGPAQSVEELSGGDVLLTFTARSEPEVLSWALSFGEYIRVLEPQWLVERIAGSAQALLENHTHI